MRCSNGRDPRDGSMTATRPRSGTRPASLGAASAPSGPEPTPSAPEGPEPQQRDEALGVVAAPDHVVELAEGRLHHLDPLVLLRLAAFVVEVPGKVGVHVLLGEAGRGVESRQVLPGSGALADLLGQLALGGLER